MTYGDDEKMQKNVGGKKRKAAEIMPLVMHNIQLAEKNEKLKYKKMKNEKQKDK